MLFCFFIKIISKTAFCGCTKLSKLILPASLAELGHLAFCECKSLEEIEFQGTKKQWGAIKKQSTWRDWTPLKVVHCSDGDVSIKEKEFKSKPWYL